MMYCVSFNSSEVFGYSVIVALTETDSEATFQRFLEDAYCSFQDYVVNWALTNLFSSLNDAADDDEIEERLERIRRHPIVEQEYCFWVGLGGSGRNNSHHSHRLLQ